MKFTIFTGCYNSERYIHRVFKSLQSQTYRDFEWIVIDDCSEDSTVALLEGFIKENPALDAKLLVNEKNQGIRLNRYKAIQMARGDFFITWDSDDEAHPGQLSRFNEIWLQYGNSSIANIFCLCQDQHGRVYGNNFPAPVIVGNYWDYYKHYFMTNANGPQERQVCSRVDLLKKYIARSFPEYNHFPDEDSLWGKLALEYNSILLNEVLRVYYNDADNTTNLSNFSRSQKAGEIYVQKLVWVNHFIKRIKNDPALRLRFIFALDFYGFLSGKTIKTIVNDINLWPSKIRAVLLALPAKLVIQYMKIKGRGL